MGWKCNSCGAMVSDDVEACLYCKAHRLSEKINGEPQTVIQINLEKKDDLIRGIQAIVDPSINYQSEKNSIKPEFASSKQVNYWLVALTIFIVLIIFSKM